MTTDIDKLAQQMREAARKATPGPWEAHEIDPDDPEWEAFGIWNEAADDEMIANGAGTASDRVFGRANANVLALLDDRERLREALKNAAGFIDTPVMRRRHGCEQFYSAVVDSVRAALATSGGGNG